MRIAGREISRDAPPFIIAEMSGNHGGSLKRAMAIVEAVAASGADALKLQTYTPDTMTLDTTRPGFVIDDPKSLWFGRSLYDLYAEAQTPWEWHEPIFQRAGELGLIAFSSPFDRSAVELLEELNVPCYKVASFEITDIPLIESIASTGKPVILSTGMATQDEIRSALDAVRAAGGGDVALLSCTSAYPAPTSSSNLAKLMHLRAWSGCEVGFSDHTEGIGAAVAAVALGATIVEKHIIDDRSTQTVDSAFSADASELRALVVECRRAWEAVGSIVYGPTGAEEQSLRFRRSLFYADDMAAGSLITLSDVRVLRPNIGLSPAIIGTVLGRTLAREVQAGQAIRLEDLT